MRNAAGDDQQPGQSSQAYSPGGKELHRGDPLLKMSAGGETPEILSGRFSLGLALRPWEGVAGRLWMAQAVTQIGARREEWR